jgi:hypothetical protein
MKTRQLSDVYGAVAPFHRIDSVLFRFVAAGCTGASSSVTDILLMTYAAAQMELTSHVSAHV